MLKESRVNDRTHGRLPSTQIAENYKMQRGHIQAYVVEQRLKHDFKSLTQISVIVVVMGWMATIFHTLDICFCSSRNSRNYRSKLL